MCIICIDFERGALRLNEARRALGEMSATLPTEHVLEIQRKLEEAQRTAEPSSTP